MKRINTVYLIQLENLPYYKIGITDNLLQRVRALETASPFDMEVICFAHLEDAYEIEQALHRKFWAHHKKGEWFKLTKKEVKFTKNSLKILSKKTKTEQKYFPKKT